MGAALALAALENDFQVVLVSGPVAIEYPKKADLHLVRTTEEMLDRSLELFPDCCAVIGAAAPCDYRPVHFSKTKLSKTTFHGSLELCETPDILAELGRRKRVDQQMIAFALETGEGASRTIQAIAKMKRKNADYIVLNGPDSLHSSETDVIIFDVSGNVCAEQRGSKTEVARSIVKLLETVPDIYTVNG